MEVRYRMKSTDFVIIFVVILMGFMLILDTFTSNQIIATQQINESDEKVQHAARDCVYGIKHTDNTKNIVGVEGGISKAELLDKFFVSLYANFGVIESEEKQALLQMYTPIFTVIDIHSFDVSYLAGESIDGTLHLTRKWSGDFAYSYIDEEANLIYTFTLGDEVSVYNSVTKKTITGDFRSIVQKLTHGKLAEYKNEDNSINEAGYAQFRDSVVIDSITKKLNYFINEHNLVTSQRGIAYNFNLPALSSVNADSIVNGSGILVLFQGLPYASNTTDAYFNSSLVSVKFEKDMNIKIVRDISSGIRVYHKKNCSEIKDREILLECDSKISAAKNGAYPCVVCNP